MLRPPPDEASPEELLAYRRLVVGLYSAYGAIVLMVGAYVAYQAVVAPLPNMASRKANEPSSLAIVDQSPINPPGK